MRIFKNLSVRLKGLFSVVLLAILIMAIGVVSLSELDRIRDASVEISDNYAESIKLLGHISADFESLNQVIYAHCMAEDDATMSSLTKKSQTLMTSITNRCNEFEESLDEGEEAENYNKFKDLYKNYLTSFNQALRYSNGNEDEKAAQIVNNELSKLSDDIDSVIQKMTDANETAMDDAAAHQTNIYNAERSIMITIMVIAFIAVVVAVIVVVFEISRPLSKMQKELNNIVKGIKDNDGDLTKRVTSDGRDEIAQLGEGVNVFIDTLQATMKQIKGSTESLNGIVNSVVDKVKTANDDSNNISAVMQELSAAMEEVASSVSNIEANATDVDSNVIDLAGASEGLLTYAAEMQTRASELENNAVENKQTTGQIVNEIIDKLQKAIEESKSVSKVNELTNEILSIAGQTNLLALNASIEAARAGEAGKGFAVVADEISQLASSSRQAANNIQTINNMVVEAVNDLIDSSNQIVSYINDSILPDYDNFVNAGKQYNDDAVHINGTVTSFNNMSADIRQLMDSITDAIKGISTAIDESANGVSSAAINTNDVVRDIIAISKEMENTENVSNELNEQSHKFTNV